mgnify:CR=1 FL=1
MDKATRERALRLLAEKRADPKMTYSDIELETGYSRRQLMRLSKRLEAEGEAEILVHGNCGGRAHNAASDDEIRVIRELKSPYPDVTIAHFRDIYIEDVIENPDRADDVERYGLVARSKSWFRELFRREGWRSPVSPTARPTPRPTATGTSPACPSCTSCPMAGRSTDSQPRHRGAPCGYATARSSKAARSTPTTGTH